MRRAEMRIISRRAAFAFAMILAVSLAGCNNDTNGTSDSSNNQGSTEATQQNILEINKIDGETYSFSATNETGQDIKAVMIKSNSTDIWGDNLITESLWKSGEVAKVYFAKGDSQSSQETPEGTRVAIKPTFDIQITLIDDATYIIHSVPAETVDGADSSHLKIDEQSSLAYLEFDNVGQFTSTLDNDKQIKETEARAAEEARVAEEQAAAAAAAAAQSNSYSNSSSSTSGSGSVSRNSGGSSQSQNAL